MRTVGLTLFAALLVGSLLLLLDPELARSGGESGSATVTVSAFAPELLRVEIVAIEPGGEIPEVPVGTKLRITVEMTHTGDEQLRRGEVTLFADLSGLSIVGPETRNFGALNAGRSKRVRWDVNADEAGLYVITAMASATVGRTGPLVSGEDSQTITILELTPLDSPTAGVEPMGAIPAGPASASSRLSPTSATSR